MTSKVTGTAEWHINSDEPDILDYDTTFKPPAQEALYEVNPYRTSDHDAVVVGLNLVNTPPIAGDDTASVPKNGSVAVDALANDSDPDGQTVTVVSHTQGSNGSVKYSAKNRNFRYTPNKGFTGTDTFTYTISDGFGGTATATVTVVVT